MEITRYRALCGDSNVVAFFSVKIPEFAGMTVNDPQHKAVGLYLTHESIHSETSHS